MAFLWFAVLVLFAGSSTARPNRIAGGQPTTIDRYPSLVQVEFREYNYMWTQNCAASLITTRYAISAAQCFDGPSFQLAQRRIRAGTTNRSSGGLVAYVLGVTYHPSYLSNNYNDGDICVIRLSGNVVFSSVIQPASIVAQGSVIQESVPVVHAGWGTTRQGGPPSAVLHDVEIYTINNTVCAERYAQLGPSYRVTENMICAGVLDVGGQGACEGDNGGPLYYENILIGIISWGYGCGHASYPRVSTSIASYTDWIASTAV
ncbi:unnamed protein product [Euphydryas editha]|uniref:Peptidase S1 domain-containing protein n=1 Tax=Euphydryas editha TaxID=104508 RepID=A0AAU9U857_EUPED|nr:unnamed protein product [Euphydryas editha]